MIETNQTDIVHFAHANGFPAGSYKKLFSFLSKGLKPVAIEKLGHNPAFPITRNWQGQVDEVCDYLANEVKQPVFGVGHSFGAVVTYMAACRHPELFKGIILLDPPVVTGITRHLLKLIRRTPLMDHVTPAQKAVTRCVQWPEGTNMVDYFSQKALFKNMDVECIADYVNAAVDEQDGGYKLGFDHQSEAQIFRTLPTNIKHYYGKLTVPAVLITGEVSTVCVPELISPFVKHNHIQHIQIPGGGHMFPLEQPQKVAELINQHIQAWQK